MDEIKRIREASLHGNVGYESFSLWGIGKPPVEPNINLRSAFAPKCLRCGNALGLMGCSYCDVPNHQPGLSAGASQQYPGGLSGLGKRLFERPKNIADALQKAHDSINKPGSAIRAGLREAFKPAAEPVDFSLPDSVINGEKFVITPVKRAKYTRPIVCKTCQDDCAVICPECDSERFDEQVAFMETLNRPMLHFKSVTREEVAAQYPDPGLSRIGETLLPAAAIIEKGMTGASVARAADHALAAVDERPDKNLEETKDFPNDYTHNRARDVIKGILDKSIKPGGIREIKRAVADREKDDDKGPKPFPSKALRLNAASWLTGR